MCFPSVKAGGGQQGGEGGGKTTKRAVQEKIMVFCGASVGRSVEWNQGRKENNFKRWLA